MSYNNGYASHQPLSLPPQPAVSAAVPTAQLVDLNLDNAAAAAPSPRHASDAGSVNGAAIPLTIKHLEEENRRKSYQVRKNRVVGQVRKRDHFTYITLSDGNTYKYVGTAFIKIQLLYELLCFM